LFQRNEGERLRAWVQYHLRLVADAGHICVYDNESDDVSTTDVLKELGTAGVDVRRTERGKKDFVQNKGNFFVQYTSHGPERAMYIPMDIDEFLVSIDVRDESKAQNITVDGVSLRLDLNVSDDVSSVRAALREMASKDYGLWNICRYRNLPEFANVYARFDTDTARLGPKFVAWGGGGRSIAGKLDRGYHSPRLARDATAHGLTRRLTFLEIHNQGAQERQRRNEMMVAQLHTFEPKSHYARMCQMSYEDIVKRQKSILNNRSACVAPAEIAKVARTAFGCQQSL